VKAFQKHIFCKTFLFFLGMVTLVGDGPNEILSFWFDYTPDLCLWAKSTRRLRAIKLRFRATVNISFGPSQRCSSRRRKAKMKIATKTMFTLLKRFDSSKQSKMYGERDLNAHHVTRMGLDER
jgi:uncharacterized protein (DUF924 family)